MRATESPGVRATWPTTMHLRATRKWPAAEAVRARCDEICIGIQDGRAARATACRPDRGAPDATLRDSASVGRRFAAGHAVDSPHRDGRASDSERHAPAATRLPDPRSPGRRVRTGSSRSAGRLTKAGNGRSPAPSRRARDRQTCTSASCSASRSAKCGGETSDGSPVRTGSRTSRRSCADGSPRRRRGSARCTDALHGCSVGHRRSGAVRTMLRREADRPGGSTAFHPSFPPFGRSTMGNSKPSAYRSFIGQAIKPPAPRKERS